MKMIPYKNLGGQSNVIAYSTTSDSITVEFRDHSLYLYNYGSAGIDNITQMKALAANGCGLNSFINKIVKKNYAKKIR